MKEYASLYRNDLLGSVVPFWDKYSLDIEYGGFFSCLNRDGKVFDTDKFIWLQARAVWTYATLYERMEANADWLQRAKQGADFLLKYGRNEAGDWYFALRQDGKPLTQAYNIFSDCFAAMAFSALHRVSAQDVYAETAQNTFRRILERKDNPKGIYNKHIAENRPLRNFSLPMILCNLSLEMAHLLDSNQVEEVIDEVLHEVMHVFLNTEKMLIYENVLADGSFSDTFDGRLMNPGHAMEAMWFVMDLAERRNDDVLFKKATAVAFSTLEFGWDQQHGGLFYFLDAKGNPPQQLEWDQKLWWVHLESLVCMSRIWRHTHDPRAKEWFKQLHEYAWNRFRDPDFGEWYGYLNRQGQPLLSLKGGKWKGFFHVPRALMEVSFSLATKGLKEVENNTL